ncbi:phosphomannomutase [uncultured Anaeromusa sp.]|uniref:phosphomannomutase n=1 Tax=uncultured Anaeromusa sp. TaxID=673273 RepID=UPI0029C6DAEF|nr:phosphomannomutase [uncultured Anaeromusa sp.]
MNLTKAAFKAYDIRGRVPEELNEELAYRVGRVFAQMYAAEKVVVGRDVRLSSEKLTIALSEGLSDGGCEVLNIGLCGTEMVYFATSHLKADGGIMVTASHNPMDYNGLKLVRKESRPISGDTGLKEIAQRATEEEWKHEVEPGKSKGFIMPRLIMESYIRHLLTYINRMKLKPLKVVVNAGNGCAGPVLDALETWLPLQFIKVNHRPDGNFPNGIPNPLLIENREATAAVVREHKADLGVAWDGDFDRCFLFDETGAFIEGYYMVGFLAEAFLRKNPGAKIIHDPRLTWNTVEMTEALGGVPVLSKSGHAFIKERMRSEDAVYGGEMSAHHYFRDFAYCDSGMIPWLLVVESMCLTGKPLSALVAERVAKFPCSGEINRRVADGKEVISRIESAYAVGEAQVDYTDGISIEYEKWRFNVRMSNTEPVLRLNVETRSDAALLEAKTQELLALIGGEPA